MKHIKLTGTCLSSELVSLTVPNTIAYMNGGIDSSNDATFITLVGATDEYSTKDDPRELSLKICTGNPNYCYWL